jgi:hypothetical protein
VANAEELGAKKGVSNSQVSNLWFEVIPQLAKSYTSLTSSLMRFTVTFGTTTFERIVSRNKRPLPGMLRFVNRRSK